MNTNSKEVYTGTLDGLGAQIDDIIDAHYGTSFTDIRYKFASDLYAGNVSGTIYLDASALGAGDLFNPIYSQNSNVPNNAKISVQGLDLTGTNGYAMSINLLTATSQLGVIMLSSGTVTDLTGSPYLSAIPYTLTLYWHEMPN